MMASYMPMLPVIMIDAYGFSILMHLMIKDFINTEDFLCTSVNKLIYIL